MATDSGEYTQETIARRLKLAEAMLAPRQQPIQHWAQGLEELAKGLVGGLHMRRAEQMEREGQAATAKYIASFLGGGGGGGGATGAAPTATSVPSVPRPEGEAVPQPGGGISALDPKSRDAVIRTMYGEAANEPFEGLAGVASVIKNRMAQGKFGGTDATSVVRAPNQFEPWNNPEARARMEALNPNDPKYQELGAIADMVFSGQQPDLTGGATHFFAPKAQAALGRPVPAWAQGQGTPIGAHTFFKPEGGGGPAGGVQSVAAGLTGAPQPAPSPSSANQRIIAGLADPRTRKAAMGLAGPIIANELSQKPTDEMREYDLYRRQGGTKSFFDYKADLKKAGSTQVSQVNAGEKAVDTEMGKLFVKRYDEVTSAGGKAAAAIGDLDIMEKALQDPNFYSGLGGERVALPLKQALTSIGVSDPKSASSMEIFGAMASRAALNSMGGSLGSGFSNADRDFITGQQPSLSKTIEGNRALIQINRKLEQRKMALADIAQNYLQKGGRDVAGLDRALRDYARANPLFSAEERKQIEAVAAMSKESASSEQGLGVGAGKPSNKAPPKVGTELDGYRFKGGDPGKPENWEKVR